MNKIASTLVSFVIIMAVTIIPAVSSPSEDWSRSGTVYTMTNEAAGNHVKSYDRAANGMLSTSGSFATGGLGTGISLGNQGGLVLSEDGSKLLVVNAGSNEISVFKVKPKGLTLTDKVNSGGIQPVSITIHDDLVYVVNAGGVQLDSPVPGLASLGKGNIAGFNLKDNGKLLPIPNSIKPLSGNSPAEISFSPDGDVLVVTEKNTNLIDTYIVKDDGLTNGPMSHTSNGQTPFGFAFDNRGNLIVSEASAGALSSYTVYEDGTLKTISGSIVDGHAAPCWVVVTGDGKFAYTNNAHDGTISSYTDNKGKLTILLPIAGRPEASTGGNIDLALSNKFLYSLNHNTIAGFKINSDGSLTSITTVAVPVGADGLAAS